MKQAFLLIFTAVVGLSGCKDKRDKGPSSAIRQLVRDIAKRNVLMGPAVGIAAERPEQWNRYEALRSTATDKELLVLTNDTNGVVRCYAFQALVERNNIDLFPVAVQHLSDTAMVHTLYGCLGGSQKVRDFFLATITNKDHHSQFYQLNKAQKATIDSLLLRQTATLPEWFTATFTNKGLDKKYAVATFLNPSFLQADFNGDTIQDIAVLVLEKATKRKGILLIHGKTNEYFLFGAGTPFGNGDKDFKWADKWSLYNKKTASETQFDKASGDIIGSKKIKLMRPGILIEDYEDGAALAGGIIYWNNKKYIWIHQGE